MTRNSTRIKIVFFIVSLTGTNINEALLRATFILNEAQNLGMLDPNSVSMIVLVSDGDPTVGKDPALGEKKEQWD